MERSMPRLLILTTTALVATIAVAASAQDGGKKRCADLLAFYDRWGSTRSEHSDGARNPARISAGIDCERGHFDAGIREMEALLVAKKFEVPVEIGAAPMLYPDEEIAEAR
jgi:hypothetical protein